MCNAFVLRVAHFPAANEQVESQVVNPARGKQVRIAEQNRNRLHGTETAPGFAAESLAQENSDINQTQQKGNQSGANQAESPFPARKKKQQCPAGQHCHVAD